MKSNGIIILRGDANLDAVKYTPRESRHVEYQTHQVKVKEITFVCQPRRMFGYPVLISIDFNDFTSPFTL